MKNDMKTDDLFDQNTKNFMHMLHVLEECKDGGNLPTRELLSQFTTVTVELRRIFLSRIVRQQTGGVVQSGLMKGYAIGDEVTWREQDDGVKLVGFYEREVCDVVQSLGTGRDILVDLGGADGYYAVGLLATGRVARSVCYESEPHSRANIHAIARRNGVQDRITVLGQATRDFYGDLARLGVDLERTFIISDIEGGEFDVFSSDCLRALSRAHIIIELHHFNFDDSAEKLSALHERAREFFDIEFLRTGSRDPADIPLLQSWNDSDRWLMCSESRGTLMNWMHLSPRT
ncbi:hypothetical protein ACS0ZG_33845 [Burkholderia gladioli]|uniref:hypothetical protein n=1 Tax=Burkholderia TaxID=32008 RepID=UPI002150AFCB|nr:hypothetical protein [Burkholderia glumae]UVS82824.1 hypothetical protein EFP18_00700 [Burkholderia glumae]